jgi:hypothetical protein
MTDNDNEKLRFDQMPFTDLVFSCDDGIQAIAKKHCNMRYYYFCLQL